jgi:hypothetical protein
VRDDAGDYLSVVDANVAPPSKLSMVVERSTDLEVTLGEDGGADHRLRLTWRNDADTPGEPYQTLRDASESATGQYGVFTRVLMPMDSLIEDIVGESVLPVSGIEFEEEVAGRLAYGNYLLIAPGTAWLEETWRTPGVVQPDGGAQRYRLTIQKQPGQIAEPMRVAIHVPEGATITGSTPGMTIEGEAATWQGELRTDQVLEVSYDP